MNSSSSSECQWCGRAPATANDDGGRTTDGDHETMPDIENHNEEEEEQAMPNVCSHCLKHHHAQGRP